MTTAELDAMPKALNILANQIQAPDHVPAMCLRDAAAMISSLRLAVADAIVRPMGTVPDSAAFWITPDEVEAAMRRFKK